MERFHVAYYQKKIKHTFPEQYYSAKLKGSFPLNFIQPQEHHTKE